MEKSTDSSRLTILVVDDEADNVAALKRALRPNEVHGCLSPTEALSLVPGVMFDVVISDQRMPQMSGVELLAKMVEISPWTLRFLLTGYTDFGVTVDAINRGQIVGYLQKPISAPLVQAAIKQALELRRLTFENSSLVAELRRQAQALEEANRQLKDGLDQRTSEVHRLNDQLRVAADCDALTGLANRGAFQRRLGEEVSRARRYRAPVTLLFCDLDRFKEINDRHGHAAGDEALKLVAEILRGQHGEFRMRPSDYAARLGGDELAVLLPNTSASDARPVAERLCHVVRKAAAEWAAARGYLVSFTASIGLAELTPDMTSADELLAAADGSVYRAKQAGRDRVDSQ